MKAFEIVLVDIFADLPACIFDVLVVLQINLIIFECTKPAFNHNIVCPSAFPVHADLNFVRFQGIKIIMPRKLAALVGIEDDRFCNGKSLLQRG